jgi:hypothetical protein
MEATGNAVHLEPWNKGKIVGQKAPFKPKDIWALRVRLDRPPHGAAARAVDRVKRRRRHHGCVVAGAAQVTAPVRWIGYAVGARAPDALGEPMRRQTPPLDAIEAFLQAARAPSFRDAADALAISPSAFSRRVQALENFVGVALFDRSTAMRPTLNDAGRHYLQTIVPAVDVLRRASPRRDERSRRLRVLAPHSLTVRWLAPRLSAFIARTDGLDVELVIGRDLAPLRLGDADVAIASGPRPWQCLCVELLAPLDGILVSAPRLAGGRAPPRHLGDLVRHRLLAVAAGAVDAMARGGRLCRSAAR